MTPPLVLGILVDIYLIILFLLLPFGYNCFYLIYCSRKYTPQIRKHLNHSQTVTVQLPIYNEKYVITRLLSSIASLRARRIHNPPFFILNQRFHYGGACMPSPVSSMPSFFIRPGPV